MGYSILMIFFSFLSFITFAINNIVPAATTAKPQKNKSLKNPYAKKMLSYIKQNFLTLPFTERWLTKFASSDSYRNAFSELIKSKAVMGYPVFVEASRKTVAQAEYTILIEKDGCVVLT